MSTSELKDLNTGLIEAVLLAQHIERLARTVDDISDRSHDIYLESTVQRCGIALMDAIQQAAWHLYRQLLRLQEITTAMAAVDQNGVAADAGGFMECERVPET